MSWGYKKNCRKGTALWTFIQNEGLSLINDLDHPTRIGNSAQLNTSPDLTFTKNTAHSRWTNTYNSFGSDHYVINTEIQLSTLARSTRRPIEIVNWDKFRQIRTSAPDTIDDLDTWTQSLSQDVALAPSTIPDTTDTDIADSRLHHMWEAHASLQKRWLANKHNRTLRLRIATLAKEIEAHAGQLARQQWGQLCDRMNDNLGLKDTWTFLYCLLDPGHTKTKPAEECQPNPAQSPPTR